MFESIWNWLVSIVTYILSFLTSKKQVHFSEDTKGGAEDTTENSVVTINENKDENVSA